MSKEAEVMIVREMAIDLQKLREKETHAPVIVKYDEAISIMIDLAYSLINES